MLVLSAMLLMLPLKKLIYIYIHGLSLLLFGLSHHMSTRYVELERKADPELKLDDFVKLERHGFHFLAQVRSSACTS